MASNPTLTFKEGDRINLNVDGAVGHPFYIKTSQTTGSGDQVSGVTNNGTTDGMVIWQTQGGDAGTYYYNCGNHAAMTGTIIIESSTPLLGYSVNVTASDNQDYTLTGTDSTGNVSGDDIDITIKEGDRINFIVDASGHPFYLKTTLGSGSTNNPTLYVNEGDIIEFNVNAIGHALMINTVYGPGRQNQLPTWVNGVDFTGGGVDGNEEDDGTVILYTATLGGTTLYYNCVNHSSMGGSIVINASSGASQTHTINVTNVGSSVYSLSGSDRNGILDDSGNLISGVVGQGSQTGVVYWTAPYGSTGTYYYQCGNHSEMNGKLIVSSSNSGDDPSYTSKTSNGGPLTKHTSAFLDVEKAGPYFTGSVPIKFSDMRRFFKEETSGTISARELQRNVNDLERNPIVPDSTENVNIVPVAASNWKTSQFRGSVKRYYATTNTNNISQLSMGRFSGANGIDWSNGGTQGVDSINQFNGNITKNVEKHIYIDKVVFSDDKGTDGDYGSGGNGRNKIPAARLIPSEPDNAVVPAHNVRIYVENTGAIYGSAGLGGYHSTGGYDANGDPKKSDPGKDGGVALKILHTGSQTDIFLKENARIWGGGGGGEQGTMGDLLGSSMEDMKHDCTRTYRVFTSLDESTGCGLDPVCAIPEDVLIPDSVESTGIPCGEIDEEDFDLMGFQKTGLCQNIVKSTAPIQGIGGKGGDGAGWKDGSPQEETLGEEGTDNACGVCPEGTTLTGGNCSSPGGTGGNGGDWGEGGVSTLPLEDGEPYDAGRGGSAICGLNPNTNQKNWVVGGTISDQTLKGEYQLGGCEGTAGDQPPVAQPAFVEVNKPHYVRFGDDAGNGTDGYGDDGAANLLVTAPPDSADGNLCNFRIRYSWDDNQNRDGIHLTGMEVAGKRFGLPTGTWYLSYPEYLRIEVFDNDSPEIRHTAMIGAWSTFMKVYAIFPGNNSDMEDQEIDNLFEKYPTNTLTNQIHQFRINFTIGPGRNNPALPGFRLYAQADNHASFSIGRVGQPSVELGSVAEFSNPGEGGDFLDVTFPPNDVRFAPGDHFLDVTIKNSSFPPGLEPEGNPDNNNNWKFNPGGVAFILSDLSNDPEFNDRFDYDYDEDSESNGYPDYMISSRQLRRISSFTSGSMIKDFALPQGFYPITWTGLNPRNVVDGRNYPSRERMQFQRGKEIQLLDDTGNDANGTFQLLNPSLVKDPTQGKIHILSGSNPPTPIMAYAENVTIIRIADSPDSNDLGFEDSTDTRAYFYPIVQAIAEEYLSGRFGRSGTYPNRGRPPDRIGLDGRVNLYLSLGGSLTDDPINTTLFDQVKADIAEKYVNTPGSTPEAQRGDIISIVYPEVNILYPGAAFRWSTSSANTLTATSTPFDPTFQFAGKSGGDQVEPTASTRYRFTAIGPGGTDIEDRNIM